MVAVLQRRADFLVEEYYNGYTVESIQADVQSLLQDLSNTNSTLQTITLDVSSVQALQDILLEVRYLSYCRNLRSHQNKQQLFAGFSYCIHMVLIQWQSKLV